MADFASAIGMARSLVIYYGRPWRLSRLARFYAQFLKPGDLAFDIGAHVGNRSLAMARAGARVIALEPQPAFHRLLARIMPSQVTVLPLAAGPDETSAQLSISRRHPTVSSLAPGYASRVAGDAGFAGVRWDRAAPVEVTTLEALIARYGRPALVKIDVETYEADVLRGLLTPVPAISFEYLPAALDVAVACVDRLAGLGDYRFNLVRGERLAFALGDWIAAEPFKIALRDAARGGRSGDVYARLAA